MVNLTATPNESALTRPVCHPACPPQDAWERGVKLFPSGLCYRACPLLAERVNEGVEVVFKFIFPPGTAEETKDMGH